MQAYLAAQRTLSGFLLACLPPLTSAYPFPVPTNARPFLPGPLMEPGPESPPQLHCGQRKANLSLKGPQGSVGGLQNTPSLCRFPPFLLTPPLLSQQQQPQKPILHNMLTSQAVCLCSQRFPLQNNLLCTHIHLARLTTNVSLARNPSLLFHPVLNPLNILSHLSECVHACSLQSCPTLCDPMDCSPPASSVHGILQARILEWGRPALTPLPPVTLISARVFFT